MCSQFFNYMIEMSYIRIIVDMNKTQNFQKSYLLTSFSLQKKSIHIEGFLPFVKNSSDA